MRCARQRSLRPTAIAATVLLVASSVAATTRSPVALAEDRPPCSDGPANAWDQVRGAILDAILPDWVHNPYGPESIDDAATRCLQLPYPNAGPVYGLPDPREGRGRNSGDPHIVTQDGLAYDFHGAGDFVLLRSPANEVEMQVRYLRSKWVSLFAGVAIRVGDTTLTVENFVRDEDPVITLDGERLVFADIGWYDLEFGFVMLTGTTVFVQLDNGVTFEADRPGLTLITPSAWEGEFEGLQGNGDGDVTNDIATADGMLVNAADTDTLYGEFFDSWYVDPAGSMFTIPFDEAKDGPIRPEQIVTLADLDPAEVAAAEQICLAAGFIAGAGLEDCTYDVAVTGDSFWAENAIAAVRSPSIPAVSLDPTVESVTELAAIGSVTGQIEQRYAADDFNIAAGVDDDVRLLRASEPCADGVGPVAIMIVDGDPIESLSLNCGAVHAVPSGAFTLRIIDPTGGTPSYGFAIAPAGVVELGVLNVGEEYSGELGEGDRAVGELALDAGRRLFVTAFDDADCGPVLRVLDSAGQPQALARGACLDLGPFEVEVTGVYTITIDPDGDSTGSHRLVVHEAADDSVVTIGFDDQVDLVVSTPGQRASAMIDLEAGDRICIETVDRIDGRLLLLGPDGDQLASMLSINDLGLFEAATAGVYTITIDAEDAATGTQRLIVHRVGDDTVIPARLGTEVDLRVSTPGQRASASIELVAGDEVDIETIERLAGRLIVTDPVGNEVVSTLTSRARFTAASAGTYAITVEPQDAATGTLVLLIRRR